MITSLPENISCTILSDWLTVRDVLRIDGANLNRLVRTRWLPLLSADGTKTRSFGRIKPSLWQRFFSWMVSRRVKFGFLDLNFLSLLQHYIRGKLEKPFIDMVESITELHLYVVESLAFLATGVFSAVREACPRLRKLVLDGEGMLSVEHICAIVSPTTVSLEIRHCTIMRWAGAAVPSFSWARLQSLVLRDVANSGLLTDFILQSGCPALEDLRTCGDISAVTAERLVQSCSHLTCLEFAPTMGDEAAVSIILGRCPHLRVLSIKDDRSITADTLRAIAQSGRALRMLSLNNLRRGVLDDTTLRLLADGIGANLVVLELNYDMFITHETAVYLLRSCPQLRGLRCQDGCSVLLGTENSTNLEEQLTLCSQLRELEGCPSTETALQLVAQHCPNLRHCSLDVGMCGGETARQFLDRCRNLSTVVVPGAGQQGYWAVVTGALLKRFYPHMKRVVPGQHLPMWEEFIAARRYL